MRRAVGMVWGAAALVMGAAPAVAQEASEAEGAAASPQAPPDGFEPRACGPAPEQMSCVPGGAFMRGHDEKDENARPAQTVWVSTFYMDQYEVTNAAYQACVKAGTCNEAGPRYRGYSGPKQPITGVSWYDAAKFCQAQGKRLPTESEWERAARGARGELNPWGDAPATCARAIIKDPKEGRACGVRKPGSKPEAGRIFDVGSRPAGRHGLHDMVGNAQEWVADWYSPSWEACGEACQGLDPKGPCEGARRCKGHREKVLRGGSWVLAGLARHGDPPPGERAVEPAVSSLRVSVRGELRAGAGAARGARRGRARPLFKRGAAPGAGGEAVSHSPARAARAAS